MRIRIEKNIYFYRNIFFYSRFIYRKGAEWKDKDLPDIKNIFRRQQTEIDFRLVRFILFLERREKSIGRRYKTDRAQSVW